MAILKEKDLPSFICNLIASVVRLEITRMYSIESKQYDPFEADIALKMKYIESLLTTVYNVSQTPKHSLSDSTNRSISISAITIQDEWIKLLVSGKENGRVGDDNANYSAGVFHSSDDGGALPKELLSEKVFSKSFEDLSVGVYKCAVLIHRRGIQHGPRDVYVLLKSRTEFTPKQLLTMKEILNAELESTSDRQGKYFNENERKQLSGRTPLDADRFEHVYHNNNAMSLEQQRRSSFVYWDLSRTPVQELVEAGFYGIDRILQLVECFSCGRSLNVAELNGRHPLIVHREISPDCQFLRSDNIRRTINNIQPHKLEPFTLSESLPNGASSSIHQTTNEIDDVSAEEGISNRRLQHSREITNKDQLEENIENSIHPDQQAQSHISQPSDEITDLQTDSLLIGNNLIPCNTKNAYIHPDPRRGDIASWHDGTINNGHLQGITEEATAAIATAMPLPNSLAQDPVPPPRNPLYEQEVARRQTFNSWNGRHDIDRLIEAGLFYTGDQDIVRCFHCDIGLAEWNRDDDPWQEHARHSHECHFLLQTKGQAYVDHVQREWAKVYSPKRPDLSHVNQRLETFHNWPSDFVVQTPRQLATAGFYYAGMTDTVRCHYCDGGLREWEPGDVPWVEHAKWFPHCKFVLKIKGLPFIEQCVARRNEVLEDPIPNNEQTQNNAVQRFNAPISNEEKYRAKEEKNPLYTAAAQAVIAMGYTTAVVAKCINAYIAHTGHRNFEATDLMNVILEREDGGGSLSGDENPGENEITEEDGFKYDAPALLKMNETMKNTQLCIECMSSGRQILFQPCGHCLLCDRCAAELTECLRCGKEIQSKTKIYLS